MSCQPPQGAGDGVREGLRLSFQPGPLVPLGKPQGSRPPGRAALSGAGPFLSAQSLNLAHGSSSPGWRGPGDGGSRDQRALASGGVRARRRRLPEEILV